MRASFKRALVRGLSLVAAANYRFMARPSVHRLVSRGLKAVNVLPMEQYQYELLAKGMSTHDAELVGCVAASYYNCAMDHMGLPNQVDPWLFIGGYQQWFKGDIMGALTTWYDAGVVGTEDAANARVMGDIMAEDVI